MILISPEEEKLMNEWREEQDFIDFEKLSFVGAIKNISILEFLETQLSLLRLFMIRVH